MKNKKVKKRKPDRLNRISLTLTFSLITFIIIFIALGISVGILYIMVWLEAIPNYSGTSIEVTPIILFISLVSLIIGFGISVLLARFPLKPFNRIISSMNALASGNFSARLSFGKVATSVPAISEVTESFNKMASELENTEMLRTDFINNFSHEFKTPIVSIAGFAKLLKHGNLTEEEKNEYIGIIEEESIRLSELATKVLNLTKVENQTILSDVSNYNLSEQIRNCVLLLENKWGVKNLEFDMDFPEIFANANEELMKQVWINLIDNAIKFSEENSVIEISLKLKDEKSNVIEVSISNHGPEIPEEEKKLIFRKFYQADKSHYEYGNGTGLAIVKKIVDLHGGKIYIESKNQKTTFTVEFESV